MTATPADLRRAALLLLHAVLVEGKPLDEHRHFTRAARLSPESRAGGMRLARGVLRHLQRVDFILREQVRKKPPIAVYNILRLGAYELCTRQAPAHAIVNDAVLLAAESPRTAGLKGFINAVLRHIARHEADISINHHANQLPEWIRSRMACCTNEGRIQRIEAALTAPPPLDLTVREQPNIWAHELGGVCLPNGTVRLNRQRVQVSTLPGYAAGAWWVQDAAAAIPVQLLQPAAVREGKPPSAIDLCAAPGGKAMQLAVAGYAVTAVDRSARRIERMKANLSRVGLAMRVEHGDALAQRGNHDLVLLDPPCTATGIIRRHPDLPHVHRENELAQLVATQATLLDHALNLMAPDGRLIYCTCSLLPEEGESQIARILDRNSRIGVDESAFDHAWVGSDWRAGRLGLRLMPDFWPDLGGLDGFFVSVLRHV